MQRKNTVSEEKGDRSFLAMDCKWSKDITENPCVWFWGTETEFKAAAWSLQPPLEGNFMLDLHSYSFLHPNAEE